MPAINMAPEDAKAVVEFIHSVLALAPGQGAPPPGSPVVLNLLVGDAGAGQAYFSARCSSCHSTTGDLKGIGARDLSTMQLQNLWVSGGRGGRGGGPARGAPPARGVAPMSSRRAVSVTVTLPSGQTITGELDRIDDFLVTLVQSDGTRRTFRRDGDVPKVEVRDPLEAHRNLLTVYTEKDIHDVTAYLTSLK
jgi:cytochrome c oxidase cbb3-type subunit III